MIANTKARFDHRLKVKAVVSATGRRRVRYAYSSSAGVANNVALASRMQQSAHRTAGLRGLVGVSWKAASTGASGRQTGAAGVLDRRGGRALYGCPRSTRTVQDRR